MADRLAAELNGVGADWRLLSPEMDEYSTGCRETAEDLWRIWEDMGVSKKEQELELREVTQETRKVWEKALERAETARSEMRSRLEGLVSKAQGIREEFEEEGVFGGLCGKEHVVDEGDCGSLKEQYEMAKAILTRLQDCRQERYYQMEKLRQELRELQNSMGLSCYARVEKNFIYSKQRSDQMQQELLFYKAEKQKREMKLESTLSELRKVCILIGENDLEMAARAHPSLQFYRDLLPSPAKPRRMMIKYVPRCEFQREHTLIDLSDETFEALEGVIKDLYNLRDSRNFQAGELSEILNNLWNILGIPESDVNRRIFSRLLNGPTKLHAASLAKCSWEVVQLESAGTAHIHDLIKKAVLELEAICESTYLPVPNVALLIPKTVQFSMTNLCSNIRGKSSRTCSEAVWKLSKLVAEAKTLKNKREELVNMILEFERSLGVVKWLAIYEKDQERYKGRGSFRKLQKALRVGKVKDKLPEMIVHLKDALLKWKQTEGFHFTFHGTNYESTLQQSLERMADFFKGCTKSSDASVKSSARSEKKEQNMPPSRITEAPSKAARSRAAKLSAKELFRLQSAHSPDVRMFPQASAKSPDTPLLADCEDLDTDPLQEMLDNMLDAWSGPYGLPFIHDPGLLQRLNKRAVVLLTGTKDSNCPPPCATCRGRNFYGPTGATFGGRVAAEGLHLSPGRFSSRYRTE